jgi:hypothetical protein
MGTNQRNWVALMGASGLVRLRARAAVTDLTRGPGATGQTWLRGHGRASNRHGRRGARRQLCRKAKDHGQLAIIKTASLLNHVRAGRVDATAKLR